MNQHRRTRAQAHRVTQIAAGLLIALSLAACGGSAAPTPTPTLAPTQMPSSTPVLATAAAAPRIVPSPTPAQDPSAATAAPTTAPAANPAGCTNKAANVRDVTIPDGVTLQRGESFNKTWRIQNAGTCTWDASYTVVFNVGDRLDGKDGVTLPNTPPGADAEVTVPMRASLRAGKFQGFWKLRAPNGQEFGTGPEGNIAFWVLITVK